MLKKIYDHYTTNEQHNNYVFVDSHRFNKLLEILIGIYTISNLSVYVTQNCVCNYACQ